MNVIRVAIALLVFWGVFMRDIAAESFEGEFYRGEGDVEYLQLLDIARRMFAPDPQFEIV